MRAGDARKETRVKERACAIGSACSPAGAWSISAETFDRRWFCQNCAVNKTLRARTVRSLDSRTVHENGALFRDALFTHGGPDNALDVAITMSRRLAVLPTCWASRLEHRHSAVTRFLAHARRND